MKKIFLTTFITVISILVFAQNNYYVSSTGSNSNNGSISEPWQTIQYGVEQLNPGDTLNITAGTYIESIQLAETNSGTNANFITIRSYQQDNVFIKAIDLDSDEILGISDANYINIWNLNFSENNKSSSCGIKITGTSHHITLDNIKVFDLNHNWAVGIILETQVNNITIQNSEIYQINAPDPQYPDKGTSGISIGGDNLDNPIHDINIINCKIHDCKLGDNEGLVMYGNVSGFLIENCELYNLNNIALDLN